MCQPKRRPTSPAQALTETLADIERIAKEWYEESYAVVYGEGMRFWRPWGELDPEIQEQTRAVARRLLRRDVIRVGRRPNVERPMAGQTTIDDPFALEDDCDAYD